MARGRMPTSSSEDTNNAKRTDSEQSSSDDSLPSNRPGRKKANLRRIPKPPKTKPPAAKTGRPKFRKGLPSRSRRSRRTSTSSMSSLVEADYSSDDDIFVFSKEWREKDRRERRFTKHSIKELHGKAEEVRRGTRLRERDREDRLQKMEDVLEDMEDHILDYKSKKETELRKKDKGEEINSKAWKKFPKPGSKPKVTFKPDQFLVKQGFLYKKGQKWRHWKKRFFRIFLDDPHSLYYYSSPRKAEEDARLKKPLRKGKRINLLFAHTDSIKKFGRGFKRIHKNSKIINDFELFIQTKSVKRINDGKGNGIKTRTVLGRVFLLCALSESEAKNWMQTLKYIEEQTDGCIKDHQEKIKKGQQLKKAYFDNLKGKKNPDTEAEEENKDDGEKIDEKQLRKWDRAQMISVYGTGVAEAVAGKKSRFLIEDNFKDLSKQKARKGRLKRLMDGIDLNKLNVVLETNELHYDLEPVPMGKGRDKFFCEYMCTRRGDYELSVLYDGLDVYGSPFKVKVDPAPISASHSFVSGQNYVLVSPVTTGTEKQSVVLNLRNRFDEKVGIRPTTTEEDQITIDISATDGITITNKGDIESLLKSMNAESDHRVLIEYSVDAQAVIQAHRQNSSLPQDDLQQDGTNMFVASISVKIDDRLSTPSFLKLVGNSPFKVNVLVQEQGMIQNTPHYSAEPKHMQQPEVQEPQFQAQQYQSNNGNYLEIPLKDIEVNESVETKRNSFGNYFNDVVDSNSFLPTMSQPSLDSASASHSQFNQHRESLFSPNSMFNSSPLRKQSHSINRPKTQRKSREAPDEFQNVTQTKSPEFDRKLLRLFDKHETVLRTVFIFFSDCSSPQATSLNAIISLGVEYDVIPTFISKKEVKSLFQRLPLTNEGGIEYDWFLVALAQIAILALSKPMFSHLYSTDKSKVNVLLTMWGIADPSKIRAIRERNN